MKIIKIIFRIIGLPFYITLLFIALIRVLLFHTFHWLVYGGELMAYSKTFNPDTIAKMLEEHQVNNKMPFQDKVDQMIKSKS